MNPVESEIVSNTHTHTHRVTEVISVVMDYDIRIATRSSGVQGRFHLLLTALTGLGACDHFSGDHSNLIAWPVLNGRVRDAAPSRGQLQWCV